MKSFSGIFILWFLSMSFTGLQAGEFDGLKEFYEPLPEMKHPADNPWSKDKEELGKLLYFDPRLSGSMLHFR